MKTRLALLAIVLFIAYAHAANWQTLSNCTYIANKSNDGDSFHVRYGTTNLIVRLNFVDTPETNLEFRDRVEAQAKYFGITADEAVKIGNEAATVVSSQLRSNTFNVTTRWANAAGRSKEKRYYCFVHVGSTDLAELLISNGLARVYGEANSGSSNNVVTAKLRLLEADAKASKRGAWALSSTNSVKVLAETGYRISGSGVRHNSKCRYYDSPSSEPCQPTDGKPCKICGG